MSSIVQPRKTGNDELVAAAPTPRAFPTGSWEREHKQQDRCSRAPRSSLTLIVNAEVNNAHTAAHQDYRRG